MNLCFSFLFCALSTAQAPTEAKIDELARAAMKHWHVPGLALVIVHEDRIVYLKGHGVRQLGGADPVTPDTVFPIASCSKSFASLALAMQVSEGKASWDDRVRKHIPFFRLADPHADALVTLRDLLAHRTGLGLHDFLWYRAGVSLEERIRRLGHLEPEFPFRQSLRYQTVAFGAAGFASGRIEHSSWRDVVQKRILDPLEMKSSAAVFHDGLKELASPHRRDEGKVAVIARYDLSEDDPAGSVHSSARDLGNYLRFQLGDGTWNGKRLLSADSLAEPHKPQTVVAAEAITKRLNPESRIVNYGLGWIVQDYRGKLLVQHGGAIDGFRAHLALVPELRLGIAVINNLDGNYANLALSNQLVDLFLSAPAHDWQTHYADIVEELVAQRQKHRVAVRKTRRPEEPPTRPLESFVGTYEHPALGVCTISLREGKLRWQWGLWKCDLEPWGGDRFAINDRPLSDQILEFAVPDVGPIPRLQFLGYVFQRKRTP